MNDVYDFLFGPISFAKYPIATTISAIALAFLGRWIYDTNYRFITGRSRYEE